MEIVQYLKDIYGYGTPIFLKDIRIGRKSKTAIRKELSRAVKDKKIIRNSPGVYCFAEEGRFQNVSFEDVIKRKYVKDDFGLAGLDIMIYGYYSGLTFAHMIGLSQQVPAIIEITTNNTSSKRTISFNGRKAIIKKGRTEITFQNYKILQFFDMLASFITIDQIKENQKLLYKYIENNFTKNDLYTYIRYYKNKVMKILVEEKLIEAFQ
jgi:hypothetical protein